MTPAPASQRLGWARELYSIARAGLTYCKNEYDLERYRRLQELSAEMIASRSKMDEEAVMESLTMQAGYITPKIDVRGAVLQDGKILLVQERSDSRWAMPGGWADLGDAPTAMVAREVLEESGLQVRPTKVVGILDANRIQPFEFYHAYKIIFLCEIQGGDLRASLETLNAAFFDRAALPELSTYRTSEAMIREAFAHGEDPTRPTFFD